MSANICGDFCVHDVKSYHRVDRIVYRIVSCAWVGYAAAAHAAAVRAAAVSVSLYLYLLQFMPAAAAATAA